MTKYKPLFKAADSIGQSSGSLIKHSVKWASTDHTGYASSASALGSFQNLRFLQASIAFDLRRIERKIEHHHQLINTGKDVSTTQLVIELFCDYLQFGWDALYGYVEPFISLVFLGMNSAFVISLINVVFFVLVFLLITS